MIKQNFANIWVRWLVGLFIALPCQIIVLKQLPNPIYGFSQYVYVIGLVSPVFLYFLRMPSIFNSLVGVSLCLGFEVASLLTLKTIELDSIRIAFTLQAFFILLVLMNGIVNSLFLIGLRHSRNGLSVS